MEREDRFVAILIQKKVYGNIVKTSSALEESSSSISREICFSFEIQ